MAESFFFCHQVTVKVRYIRTVLVDDYSDALSVRDSCIHGDIEVNDECLARLLYQFRNNVNEYGLSLGRYAFR